MIFVMFLIFEKKGGIQSHYCYRRGGRRISQRASRITTWRQLWDNSKTNSGKEGGNPVEIFLGALSAAKGGKGSKGKANNNEN